MKAFLLLFFITVTTMTSKGENDFNLTLNQIADRWAAYGDRIYEVRKMEDGKTYMTYNISNMYTLTYRFDLEGKCEALFKVYINKDLYIIDLVATMKKYPYNPSTGKLQDSEGVSVVFDKEHNIISFYRP